MDVPQHFPNHLQLVDLDLELWLTLGKMNGKTCQKHHFVNNLSFTDPKFAISTVLESHKCYLAVALDLACK